MLETKILIIIIIIIIRIIVIIIHTTNNNNDQFVFSNVVASANIVAFVSLSGNLNSNQHLNFTNAF